MELQAKSIHETNFLIGATYCEIAMDGFCIHETHHGALKPQLLIRTSLLHRSSWDGPFYKPKIIGVNNHRTFFSPINSHTYLHTYLHHVVAKIFWEVIFVICFKAAAKKRWPKPFSGTRRCKAFNKSINNNAQLKPSPSRP